MKQVELWLRKNIFIVLDVVKFLGIMVLILMFINFNAQVADQTKTTQDIVKSQNKILEAIKQLAMDDKNTSEQKTNIIICMLQVPVEQRTTDTVTNCRKQVEDGNFPVPPITSTQATQNAQSAQSTQPSKVPTAQVPKRSFVSPAVDFINEVLKKVGL